MTTAYRTIDGGGADTLVSPIKPLPTTIGAAASDAFGRLRVGQPLTIFESATALHALGSIGWREVR